MPDPVLTLKLLALGVLQGLTEFFPVSSSGHLGLAELLLDVRLEEHGAATTEVALHVGTLFAVLWFLRRDLHAMARALLLPGFAGTEERRGARTLLVALALATLPAAVVGLLWEDRLEALFGSPVVIGVGLLVTGALLLGSRLVQGGAIDAGRLRPLTALLIGCAQVVAMVPGISRSGTTIVAGMALDMQPPEAGRFSFLLAVPVIGGAALLKLSDILAVPGDQRTALLAGVVAAFLSGLLALRFLTLLLRRGRLFAFAYYVIPLGVTALVAAGRA